MKIKKIRITNDIISSKEAVISDSRIILYYKKKLNFEYNLYFLNVHKI